MFTGIVEELGEIEELVELADSARITVAATTVTEDAVTGCSISVDGVCLTVVEHNANGFTADVMPETLHRSTLGTKRAGDRVNLERAMLANGRLGGHIVSGHVDAVGQVVSRTPGDRWEVVRISFPESLAAQIVEKGSITIDGISLTVTGVDDSHWLEVSLIPETLAMTTLGHRQPGEQVNLETDVIAKYVQRLLTERGSA